MLIFHRRTNRQHWRADPRHREGSCSWAGRGCSAQSILCILVPTAPPEQSKQEPAWTPPGLQQSPQTATRASAASSDPWSEQGAASTQCLIIFSHFLCKSLTIQSSHSDPQLRCSTRLCVHWHPPPGPAAAGFYTPASLGAA